MEDKRPGYGLRFPFLPATSYFKRLVIMPPWRNRQRRTFVMSRLGVQVPLAAVITKKPSRGDDVFTNSSNNYKKESFNYGIYL